MSAQISLNGKRKKRLRFLQVAFLWEQRESNPRPSACKADALNQLSYAPETGLQIYGHFSNLQILFHPFSKFFFIKVSIRIDDLRTLEQVLSYNPLIVNKIDVTN